MDWLTGMRQDIRYALRLFRREPGYTVVAVLTIALGIAATTTLFSVAYGVLFKPLSWPDADRLVRLEERRGDARDAFRGRSATLPISPGETIRIPSKRSAGGECSG